MKASQFFISTFKEAPADAEVISHQLMMRAGMIKKLGAGIYTYMPMGLRVIQKVAAIIRDEMNKAGALELTMPMIQSAELWQETGRYEKMGPELLRIQDRHERAFVIQPTSEEVVTDIARQEFRSYKQLPKNLYQIQTKFRDERRPRFGLMRGREFIMKDAYSFDKTDQEAKKSYQIMAQTYRAIFDRFGLRYRAVSADSGAIGGDLSEEFQVIAATGEDAIVYCPQSDYAANLEKAQALAPQGTRAAPTQEKIAIATPQAKTCEEVAQQLKIALQQVMKSLVLVTETQEESNALSVKTYWIILLRADHEMNEVKLGQLPMFANGWRFASASEIESQFACLPGSIGPIGFKNTHYIADREVMLMSDFVCGANQNGYHFQGVNWQRDLEEPTMVADLRNVVSGDLSPDGKGPLMIERGIEVGHIFYLGTQYSRSMKATFLDEKGKPQYFEMGCYGIGVTRLPAAAIEQNHDEKGIIWPDAIAPFTVVICPIGADKNPAVQEQALAIYQGLINKGVDVILDDRLERPGVMFADWELIGVPHRLVISQKGLDQGVIEYQHRRDLLATPIEKNKAIDEVAERIQI